MIRLPSILALTISLAAITTSARIIEIPSSSTEQGPCTLPENGNWQCSFLSALLEPPAQVGEIDTIVFTREADTPRNLIWFFQNNYDIYKPVVLLDSSYMATGNVRTRIEGIQLSFRASPVHVEGFSFTQAGPNYRSIVLHGPGPDRIKGNLFNLTPTDSATESLWSRFGILVGFNNVNTRIENNLFGAYGNNSTQGQGILIYGDSTQVLNNRFGINRAGNPVNFTSTAVVVTGSTGNMTNYSPRGGTISGNWFGTCGQNGSGILLSGSRGQGGTRGWLITGNKFGVSTTDTTKVMSNCNTQIFTTAYAIQLAGMEPGDTLTGNTVRDNKIWRAGTGIIIAGSEAWQNTVRRNQIGIPDQTLTEPTITYDGMRLVFGARNNTIDSNVIAGSRTGLRFGLGTTSGDGIDNIVRANVIGAIGTNTGHANDTAINLASSSSGNLLEHNVIVGNRHQGLLLTGNFLQPNSIQHNRFGITTDGLLRPNGGSSIRTSGAGRQVIRHNLFGPSTAWGIEIRTSLTRATVLDSNRFLGGQDSGAIYFFYSDSMYVLDNRFDSCSVACIQIVGSKIGLIARNRFGGQSPALFAQNHPTLASLITSSVLDENVLPAIPTPIEMIGAASLPNRGPMGMLNRPMLKTASVQGDSAVVTYDLPELQSWAGAPRVHLYAKLPDSTVLLPLGSWPSQTGTGIRLAFIPRFALPSGTLLRAGLTDSNGYASKIDSGLSLSGGVGIAEHAGRTPELKSSPRWVSGHLMLTLQEPARVSWETRRLNGRLREQATVLLEAGAHAIPVSADREPTVLRVEVDGKRHNLRLPPTLLQ